MDGSLDFNASRLSFEVAGEGVAVDPATGRLSIDTGRLPDGVVVTVTASNAAGSPVGRLRLTLATVTVEAAPVLVAAPALAGASEGRGFVGTALTLDPGIWSGVPAPELAIAWLLDGEVVEGAAGPLYTPAAADEGKALVARVTARNATGEASAETAALVIVHAAPTVLAPLADVLVEAGAKTVAVAAAGAFEGQALTFAVNGAGAAIDSATGVVTIATDQLLDQERITVTATNSGGSASASFSATVRAVPPVCLRQPTLGAASGAASEEQGVVGTAVTLDPGTWEGVPAPELAIAWLVDGAIVEGVAGPLYTPAGADEGKALAARVTARNAGGAASAETAALAIVHAAPLVVAPLADVALITGHAAAVVEAAAAFEGLALVFSVEGGGASIDATGRVTVPAAEVGSATVTVTATNSGGSARVSFVATVSERIAPPVLVLAPALAGSGRIGEPVTVSAGSWSGVPAATTSVAWLRNGTAIAGAAGTHYTPVAADDGESLSARVTATNTAGSVEVVTAALAITYAPPVARGELAEEVFDLGSGVQTVSAGADFTGEALRFAVSGAGATIDDTFGVVSIPTDSAVQATVTVTATNSGGSATSSFGVTVEAEDVPFALEADDIVIAASVWRPAAQEVWFTPVVRFPGLEGETVHAIEWTTGTKALIPETEYEVVTKVGRDSYQLNMRDPAKNAPGATPRADYSVFRLTETNRREALRFRWRRTAEGPWSGLSPAFPVPAPAAGWPAYQRFTMRSEDQEALGEPGGTGMQFPRAFDAEGDYVHMGFDVTWAAESTNYGDDWTSEACDGLWISQTYSGVCVDGKYVHAMTGPLFMQNASASYDTKGGLYRKNRETGKWTFTRALPNVFGSNSGIMRRNQRYIAKVAGSGSGPDTRTLYAIHAPAANASEFTTIQILKSTDGGASWAEDGGALAVSTYGRPLELWADATALYLNTLTGCWRRPAAGTAWTKATGLPGGEVRHLEKRGTTVYACVEGQGLYTASDAATLAFTLKKSFGIGYFSVSPTNPDRIVLVPSNGTAIGTHDGGSTWFNVSSLPYPGQPNDFAHKLSGPPAWVRFHDTDPNIVLAMRFQHMGKSTDGGRTFVWSSRNLDYSEVRSIAYHRTEYRRLFLGMTDRLLLASEHGAAFVIDDNFDDNVKGAVETALADTLKAFTASGTLLLDRGAHTGYVAQVGNHIGSGAKTPVVLSRSVTTTETDRSTTGNGTISVTASPDLPAGTYTLTCTAVASNGGTFTGAGPLGVGLGTWTVGTERTYTHPRGGTLAVKINGGSTGFAAGSKPKVFTIFVNPIASAQILNPDTKNVSLFGQVNPAVGHRGISGRHVFEMDAGGGISLVRTIAYPFQGYMGRGGSVVLATNGTGTLMRSADEGVSWATFASGLGNFSGRGSPIVTASSHDDKRAYVGTSDGMVKRIQNGSVATVFSFDRWCTDNGISGNWPGNATVNGRLVPPVSGIAESYHNPALLYCCVYLFGAPYQMFRTENALAASPTWECITSPGSLSGPLQGMSIHPLTDEPVIISSHGTVWYKPKAEHLAAYSITNSIIDDLRAGRGGDYWRTAEA